MTPASLGHDLGFAARRLLRAPAYATTVVLLLAFAIGANVVLGAAVYAMRWKALPFADGARLDVVNAELRSLGLTLPTSVYVLDRLEREGQGFRATGYAETQAIKARDGGDAWSVTPVRPGLFDVLGVAPALGRGFIASDAVDGADDAVVISHAAWQARFHGDPGIVGRTVAIGARTRTIVGVMPATFAFPDRDTQAWSPFVFTDAAMAQARAGNIGDAYTLVRRDADTTRAQLQARVEAAFATDETMNGLRMGAGLAFTTTSLRDSWAGERTRGLLLLQGALILVLLAVVTNVASLMVERLLARQQELGVRAAIGADRARLFASAGAEAVWLLAAGVFVGVALAPAGGRILAASGAIDARLPFVVGAPLDLALIALGTGLVAGLAFAVIPLVTVFGTGATQWFRPGASTRYESRAAAHVRRLLVVAQLAITTVLLTGAGLMTRSVVNLLDADTGFDRRHVVVAGVRPPRGGTVAPFDAVALETLREKVAALPGVAHAVLANMAPLSHSESMSTYGLASDAQGDERSGRSYLVGPGYFRALGITLRRGRDFTAADLRPGARVAIIDAVMAERDFAGRDPIGQVLRTAETPNGGDLVASEIIGVADVVKHRGLDETTDNASFYRPFTGAQTFFTIVLRTDGDPSTLVAPLRATIAAQLPDGEIAFASPLSEMARQSVRDRETVLQLLGAFALVAAIVSATGLYALLAVTVRRRAREIGVRQALGADARDVRRWVMAQSLRVAAIGVVVGGIASLALSRVLGAHLYGVSAHDPLTLGGVMVLVGLIALAATLMPAWRAARMDPQACLRAQ